MVEKVIYAEWAIHYSPLMQADIRLLVLDIDGTIAGKDNRISAALKDAVRAARARGIKVAIATGRMFCSAKKYHAELDLGLPIIAYNGAWIQSPSAAIPLRQLSLPSEIGLDILDCLGQVPWRSQLDLHIYADDRLHVQEITDRTRGYMQRTGCQAHVSDDLQEIVSRRPTKILAVCHSPELAKPLLAAMSDRFSSEQLYCTQSTAVYVEFTSPLATKGQAVQFLGEEQLGLLAHQIMAIGDNYNDREMLQYAGLGVAMGNAPADIQTVADAVCPTVENEGVAQAIHQFLL